MKTIEEKRAEMQAKIDRMDVIATVIENLNRDVYFMADDPEILEGEDMAMSDEDYRASWHYVTVDYCGEDTTRVYNDGSCYAKKIKATIALIAELEAMATK